MSRRPSRGSREHGTGPWIWSPAQDLAAFGGSAAVALAAVIVGHLSGVSSRPMSDFTWLLLVVGIDVSHVWSTLFRTYLDREELARRPVLYAAVPLGCYAVGVAFHLVSRIAFWRLLAYVAVFHFVRQQIGWVAIYRARAGDASRAARLLEEGAVYAATLYPLFVCHTRPSRRFAWFIDGDFVSAASIAGWTTPLGVLSALLLGGWAVRQAHRFFQGHREVGRITVVVTTALTWWMGLVATNSDFDFTVSNVIVHGVPYMVLLFAYARARAREVPGAAIAKMVAPGPAAFLMVLLCLAFFEEAIWDRLVWHDHPSLFGDAGEALSRFAEAWLVPLLAVPQATHYVLDAVIWRRKGAPSAQATALGFASRRAWLRAA